MKRATFALIVIAMMLVAVACQYVLPDMPIIQRITETTEPGRGVRGGGDVGVMVDPTATPTITLAPGFYIYLDPVKRFGTRDCRELIEGGYPTAEPVWTRVTTNNPFDEISNGLKICHTYNAGARFRVIPIGYSQGHSHSGDWETTCGTGRGCAASSGLPYSPSTDDVGGCGLSGGTWRITDTEGRVITLGPWVINGTEGYNEGVINMTTASVGCWFGCCATSYHGYIITGVGEVIEGEGDCDSTTSPICISEINAMQDATPTTSAMKDYNLRGLKGANDEYVEVVCFEPMSAAGWSLSNGTSTYIYEQDNFCWPLKAIFCDEMPDCDLETGFTDSGIWRLYDPDGNQRDVRSYPVMETPGNSWAAEDYLHPEDTWIEIKPHPGTFPTNTATATPTPTITPTPTATPTRTPTPTP